MDYNKRTDVDVAHPFAGFVLGKSMNERKVRRRTSHVHDGETESFSRMAGLALSMDATIITDANGIVLYWNDAAEALFDASALKAIGSDIRCLLPLQLQDIYRDIEVRLAAKGRWDGMLEIVRANGRTARVLSRFIREIDAGHHDNEDRQHHVVSLHTDLSKAERQDHAATLDWNLKATFTRLFGQHPDGVLALDRNGSLLAANTALSTMTGYAHSALLSIPLVDLVDPHDRDALRTAFADACNGTPQSNEFRLVLRDGTGLDASLALLPNVVDSNIIGVHGIVRDISERSANRRRILYLANHDSLTGLPNRNLLYDRMQLAFERARREGFRIALLFMDLDRFKIINDSLGHDAGDHLLRTIADRLRAAVRDVDTVARLGGDEFVVLLEKVQDATQIELIAHDLLADICKPMMLGGTSVEVSSSIGGSIYPDQGSSAAALLKNADLAMYAAKAAGLSRYQLYSDDLNDRAQERLSSENSLRRAIARGELVVHYQPRLELATNRVVAVEALVRWDHPEKGMVYPKSFIALAEETGMINALGEWVLESACLQMGAWRKSGMQPLNMSVNISALQLQSVGICERIAAILEKTDFDPALLELEITESSLMQDMQASVNTLNAFRQRGISLAIDDFGTGYSSLTYLKMLPISLLKIDRSFVHNLPGDADDSAIVEATIAMARSMKLRVVAEGVTTFEQVQFLGNLGCNEIQGYLVCQPLPANELETFLRTCPLRQLEQSWESHAWAG